MLNALLCFSGTYLFGAIPAAYLVARYIKGIDIRDYGSGNVGATNVVVHIGKFIGLSLGAFDCLAKGTLPVVVAKLLDQSLQVQAGMGLVAIVGHNWSPYLRFTGGRGVATAIGVVLGFAMWEEFLILSVIAVLGCLIFRDTGFWTFISMLTLPALTYLFDRPPEVFCMTLLIGLLLLLKRLTANWERPSTGYPLAQIMACRVLWDRDVPKKENWTARRPLEE